MRKKKKENGGMLLVCETLDYADATGHLTRNIYARRLLQYLVIAATSKTGPLDILAGAKRNCGTNKISIPFPQKEILPEKPTEGEKREAAKAMREMSEKMFCGESGEAMFEFEWDADDAGYSLPLKVKVALNIWQLLLNFDNGYVIYDHLIASKLHSAAAAFIYKRTATVRTPFVAGLCELLAITGANDTGSLKKALAEARDELDTASPVSMDFFENRDPVTGETDGFLFVPKVTGACADIGLEDHGSSLWLTPEILEEQLFLNPDGLRNPFSRRILACLIEAAKQAVYGSDKNERRYEISRNFLSIQIRFPFSYITPEFSEDTARQRSVTVEALASLVHLGFTWNDDNRNGLTIFGNAYGDTEDEQMALFYFSEDVWDIFIDWARTKKEYDTETALKLKSVEAHYFYNRLCSAKVPFPLDADGLRRQTGTDRAEGEDIGNGLFTAIENARTELSQFPSVSFRFHLTESGDSEQNIIICPEHERRRYPRLRIAH